MRTYSDLVMGRVTVARGSNDDGDGGSGDRRKQELVDEGAAALAWLFGGLGRGRGRGRSTAAGDGREATDKAGCA